MHQLVARYNDVDPEEHKLLLARHDALVAEKETSLGQIAELKEQVEKLTAEVSASQVAINIY